VTTLPRRITHLQPLTLGVIADRGVLVKGRSATELVDLVANGTATLKYLPETHLAAEQAVGYAAEITLWAAR
jgi:hypothetical protein